MSCSKVYADGHAALRRDKGYAKEGNCVEALLERAGEKAAAAPTTKDLSLPVVAR